MEHYNIIKGNVLYIFAEETQYNNDILAMISPEGEKVSLGKVSRFLL